MVKIQRLGAFLLAVISFSITSCKDEDPVIKEGIQRSELTFTEVSGEGVHPHGDHFHGLNEAVEGEKIVVKFDANGNATSNGHLHLEADAVYKLELKAWDHNDKEVQNDFVSSKAVADSYKAFLIGGDFILNTESASESGALFQPRDLTYGDGSAVNGKYETTGILSYLTIGEENEGPTRNVTYVLRKLNVGVKAKIERADWNRSDYSTAFAGENILELKFEIHAEHGHAH